MLDWSFIFDPSYKTNSFGYTINNLKQQQSQLKDQKADLEVSAARLRSLDRVAGSDVAKNLVAATPTGSPLSNK